MSIDLMHMPCCEPNSTILSCYKKGKSNKLNVSAWHWLWLYFWSVLQSINFQPKMNCFLYFSRNVHWRCDAWVEHNVALDTGHEKKANWIEHAHWDGHIDILCMCYRLSYIMLGNMKWKISSSVETDEKMKMNGIETDRQKEEEEEGKTQFV